MSFALLHDLVEDKGSDHVTIGGILLGCSICTFLRKLLLVVLLFWQWARLSDRGNSIDFPWQTEDFLFDSLAAFLVDICLSTTYAS